MRFPLERTAGAPHELTAYLGVFVLYGLLVGAVLAVVRRWQLRAGRAANAPALLPVLLVAKPDKFQWLVVKQKHKPTPNGY